VLELDLSREDTMRLSRLEDQERIARDLHDSVIQRLFATGLSLHGAMRLAPDEALGRRIVTAIDELDATIRHIRTVIFGFELAPDEAAVTLRSRTLDLCAEATRSLGFEPQVTFDGPLDSAVPPPLAEEMLAVMREALSNIGRHARARHVAVELAADPDRLTLTVTDDGIGLAPAANGSGGHGLRNMKARAAHLGGTFDATTPDTGGTHLCWSVPISS
jgi:signal transduction histidine kinase